MTRKYWQFQILLVAFVCVQFICPLFCTAFEQKMCNSISIAIQSEYTEFGSSCCHNAKTNTTDESEIPPVTDNSCCISDLEIVLPHDTFNADAVRESVEQHFVSNVPLSSTQPVAQEQLLHFSLPPKLFFSSLNRNLSRRGPPITHN